jgi:hypothetical protein
VALLERATRLTPEQFALEAEPAFRKVFKTFALRDANLKEEIFQDNVAAGLVWECDCFHLFARQFAAVSEAARAIGDDHLLYTILYAPMTPEAFTWRLPLVGYEEYYLAEERSDAFERIGIPLERALYSPTGSWGVVSHDPFSIVGGTLEFVECVKHEYRYWQSDLAGFVESMREAGSQRGVNVTWVQPLLNSLYGVDAPTFEPDEANRGAA